MAEVLQIEPSLESQRFDQAIGDVPLRWRIYWNRRAQAYYIDISDIDDEPIASGVKVVIGWDLFYTLSDDRLPEGALIVRGDEQPGKYDLGDTVQIIFLDRSDYDA